MKQLYRYYWGNTPVRKTLKGRLCHIITIGKKNTVLLKFIDNGELVTTSRRALRKWINL